MTFSKLLKPRFLNPQTMECDLVDEKGSVQKISFALPENEQKGVNQYFDYIVENYHLEEIKAQYESELKIHRDKQRQQQLASQRRKESEELKKLFDLKAQLFDMPFIKNCNQEMRSAIRRAPNTIVLNLIVSIAFETYIKENNMSCNDYLDYLDDLQYKEENE